jgi:hypothetical protein
MQEMYAWPDMSLDDMNTTLALEQFLQQSVRRDSANLELIVSQPESADSSMWQYEHLRYCVICIGRDMRLVSFRLARCFFYILFSFSADCLIPIQLARSLILTLACLDLPMPPSLLVILSFLMFTLVLPQVILSPTRRPHSCLDWPLYQ